MAKLNQDKIILITGINGYLASITGLQVLQKGYTLRGSCRSRDRVQNLLNGGFKKYASQIEIVEVPDMTVPGAFDEAVKGVHAILHMAAPVINKASKPSELIRPTVDGAVGILNSAFAHAGPQLASLIFTSSAAAIINPEAKPPHTYNDESWNEVHEAQAAELGEDASLYAAYPAGKIGAERALWAFRESDKPSFAITTVHGAIGTGPPVHLPSSPADLPFTIQPVYRALTGTPGAGPQESIKKMIGTTPYVDIRDLAGVHIWAFEHPEQADGQRYLAIAGHGAKQALYDTLRAAYPERRDVIVEGEPGVGYQKDFAFEEDGVRFDSSKTVRETGMKWIGYDQSVLDTAKAFEAYL
ncbi:MAG: putative secondary metabolism biosynthetic enzyme [Piccolia ochrophora]|nr:MAG: putative secondary metabolism biosynthetic enzyme [Piccolia ochrophora]